jgi:hypothetical protein
LKTAPVGPVGELIADATHRLSYSLGDAARAINQAARDTEGVAATYGPSTVHKWIRGVLPQPEARRWIAVGLGIPLERLLEAVEAVEAQRTVGGRSDIEQPNSPAHDVPAGGSIPYADGSKATIRVSSADDEFVTVVVRRREFLEVLGTAAGAAALLKVQDDKSDVAATIAAPVTATERSALSEALGQNIAAAWTLFHIADTKQMLAVGQGLSDTSSPWKLSGCAPSAR